MTTPRSRPVWAPTSRTHAEHSPEPSRCTSRGGIGLGRRACRRDLAPPFNPVASLPGELLDRFLRLGDLDPGDFPVESAPRTFPGDFLAEPFPIDKVDDQARHVS